MNGKMLYKHTCILPSTHQKLHVSCTEIYSGFCFLLKDKEFVSKSINDSNIDLEKFPESNVRQLGKNMESSKSTACHIKQVASEPQVAQVSLVRYQRTDLQPSKSKQKAETTFRSSEHNHSGPPYKKRFDPNKAHQRKDRCSKCSDIRHVEGFNCPARKFQCKTCREYGHFTSLCYKKKVSFKSNTPKAHQLQAGNVYMQEDSICSQSGDLTSSD